MKKLILGLLVATQFAIAMDKIIKMPGEAVLQKRLDDIGMRYFAEKTNIISELADQEKVPLGVAMTLESAIHDYFEYINKCMPEKMMISQMAQIKMHKPLIFKALLKDEPAALEELKQLGLYNPIK